MRTMVLLSAMASVFAGLAFGGVAQAESIRNPNLAEKCLDTWLSNPAQAYSVSVWSPEPGVNGAYPIGRAFSVQMRAAAPSYLTLFHVSSSCKASELVSNQKAAAGETVAWPRNGVKAILKPPGGVETYIAVATTKPLSWRAESDALGGGAEGVVSLDMSPGAFANRLTDVLHRLAPEDWATTSFAMSIVSLPKGAAATE